MSILGAGTPTLDTGTLDPSTPDADFSHFQLILADFSAWRLQGLALDPGTPDLRPPERDFLVYLN